MHVFQGTFPPVSLSTDNKTHEYVVDDAHYFFPSILFIYVAIIFNNRNATHFRKRKKMRGRRRRKKTERKGGEERDCKLLVIERERAKGV